MEADVSRDNERFVDLDRVRDLDGECLNPLLIDSDLSIDGLRDWFDKSERTDNSDNLSI